MMDNKRLEELRRRVEKDPAAFVFAQLAEEYRRAGAYRDAIQTCRAGLLQHPGYHSARVILARCFVATGDLKAAEIEFRKVLRAAPDNLSASRGLAEIHERRDGTPETRVSGESPVADASSADSLPPLEDFLRAIVEYRRRPPIARH